jgi:beta-lactam-binding protein with PASTA domain
VPAANRAERADESEDRVPDVSGKSARDAVRLLAFRGLSARLSGAGFVVSQEPPAGSPAERGSSCALQLAQQVAPGETP